MIELKVKLRKIANNNGKDNSYHSKDNQMTIMHAIHFPYLF